MFEFQLFKVRPKHENVAQVEIFFLSSLFFSFGSDVDVGVGVCWSRQKGLVIMTPKEGVMIMAGAFCVLEKEGLGFLQFILVLRASRAKNTDYCGRRDTHTEEGRDLHLETAQKGVTACSSRRLNEQPAKVAK